MRFQNAQSLEFKSDLRFTFVIKENISVDYHYHFQNTNYSQETVQIISQASNLHSRSDCYQLIKELDPPIISKVSERLEQPESQQKPPEANLVVAGTPFYRSLSIPFCLRMPPRRAPATNANTDIATILTQLVTQLTQANGATNGNNGGNGSNSGNNGGNGGNGGNNPPQCTFKHFNSCNPLKFYGTEGATGLLQWFESIENTFLNSDCPDNLRVRHATSVLQKRALTWWNGEKRNRGVDIAMALPWEEVKRLMTEEFCPRNEVKKLEAEFWDLAQDSGESLAYTTRFHELSLLVPHMVEILLLWRMLFVYLLP
ncbi:hypothetical protein L1987_52986 [Smallanthus sonchifolius]|uniref:Uncharacterized protein n=1 Tax=Smallanthus sonchifolius TaxID=185202 RepID=A0ACB9EUS2_9ASTR|nr:hypothetical protein L1987_52986 [Smallanthus sonchifolius]